MNEPRWHTDPRTCTHSNDDVCPTCDFDRYYASTYPSCPWRKVAPDSDQPVLVETVDAVTCECGHPAINHHGTDPEQGCFGWSLADLCYCDLTCHGVVAARRVEVER